MSASNLEFIGWRQARFEHNERANAKLDMPLFVLFDEMRDVCRFDADTFRHIKPVTSKAVLESQLLDARLNVPDHLWAARGVC